MNSMSFYSILSVAGSDGVTGFTPFYIVLAIALLMQFIYGSHLSFSIF